MTTPGIHVPFTTDPILWDQAVKLGNQVIWLQTYGAAFSSPDHPPANVRLPVGDPRQPLCTKPIASRMRESIAYDSERHVLAMGDGDFAPVRPEVMEYTVGGRNIFKSWFDHRRRKTGRKERFGTGPRFPGTWDADWTTEAIDLLTVLTRLVELEPAQADVLTRILAGDLISMDELAKSGTRWPASQQDRKPRFGYNSLRPVGPIGQPRVVVAAKAERPHCRHLAQRRPGRRCAPRFRLGTPSCLGGCVGAVPPP